MSPIKVIANGTFDVIFQEYFETFGEIESVKLKMDPVTGRSRGFAFLLYKDIESVVKAADGSEHQIKVKTLESNCLGF